MLLVCGVLTPTRSAVQLPSSLYVTSPSMRTQQVTDPYSDPRCARSGRCIWVLPLGYSTRTTCRS